jgi:hypothetical protein
MMANWPVRKFCNSTYPQLCTPPENTTKQNTPAPTAATTEEESPEKKALDEFLTKIPTVFDPSSAINKFFWARHAQERVRVCELIQANDVLTNFDMTPPVTVYPFDEFFSSYNPRSFCNDSAFDFAQRIRANTLKWKNLRTELEIGITNEETDILTSVALPTLHGGYSDRLRKLCHITAELLKQKHLNTKSFQTFTARATDFKSWSPDPSIDKTDLVDHFMDHLEEQGIDLASCCNKKIVDNNSSLETTIDPESTQDDSNSLSTYTTPVPRVHFNDPDAHLFITAFDVPFSFKLDNPLPSSSAISNESFYIELLIHARMALISHP